ncbi:hypothetical protein EN871_24685 [bacterium M00.F.Ca.ET.228.01.1.1]|uniref:hypothetical protein n=1 Tax=Paraburkholderia phenoliruptrix TaxID=252970 RepID=UPI00109217FB|nr:hypothetical protein [Paraburkholderia phenoliruptrix]TGP41242.1 hypothetical protein EN871_24685 [bacterium M00.F.Ca.ET.228.01.1.1]TGR97788.1 hypothetical protein EN834_24300 [bacterium M00.F.Ca.ET.191.01.1.1]TGU01955.1 hypothetical protein EN798_25120 [bacterium M00.F.Ca.ET.155.01.1.1]MBW0450368.1 hypothetical protein [Paraburkholderia phenoliruptrix]MBW9098810.1 hypothetical protein [Paraburkholderia phenoliruptrix]
MSKADGKGKCDSRDCRAALAGPRSRRRRALLAAGALSALLGGCVTNRSGDSDGLAQGVVWQPDADHLDPRGDWQRLGASDLLVQWTAVDDTAYLPGLEGTSSSGSAGAAANALKTARRLPDWTRIANEPWARNVIVGLAGRFDETSARAHAAQLIEQSRRLADVRPPVHVAGYYFPVEVDPTWKDAAALGPLLGGLPRPLWISVYDNSNIGGKALAAWLDGWLPRDVGVFFQDGCGLYTRGPTAAREYADALAARLGASRVRIIAEAFRPAVGGAFRSASAAELAPQLRAYRGHRVYLFDGPHYVSAQLVQELLALEGPRS